MQAAVVVVAPITMPAAAVVVALFIPLHTLCLRVPASAIQSARVVMAGPPVALPEQTVRTLYLAHLHPLAAVPAPVLTTGGTTAELAGPAAAVLAAAAGALVPVAAVPAHRATQVVPDITSLAEPLAVVAAVRVQWAALVPLIRAAPAVSAQAFRLLEPRLAMAAAAAAPVAHATVLALVALVAPAAAVMAVALLPKQQQAAPMVLAVAVAVDGAAAVVRAVPADPELWSLNIPPPVVAHMR